MYVLFKSGLNRKEAICEAATVEELKAEVEKDFANMFIEEDADHPDHFDIFAYNTSTSCVYAIEPKKAQ